MREKIDTLGRAESIWSLHNLVWPVLGGLWVYLVKATDWLSRHIDPWGLMGWALFFCVSALASLAFLALAGRLYRGVSFSRLNDAEPLEVVADQNADILVTGTRHRAFNQSPRACFGFRLVALRELHNVKVRLRVSEVDTGWQFHDEIEEFDLLPAGEEEQFYPSEIECSDGEVYYHPDGGKKSLSREGELLFNLTLVQKGLPSQNWFYRIGNRSNHVNEVQLYQTDGGGIFLMPEIGGLND